MGGYFVVDYILFNEANHEIFELSHCLIILIDLLRGDFDCHCEERSINVYHLFVALFTTLGVDNHRFNYGIIMHPYGWNTLIEPYIS